jgi:thiosulfate dehydrogenase
MTRTIARLAGCASAALALVSMPALAAGIEAAPQSPRGETIARQGTARGVTACISCHGAHGEGNPSGGFPRLAGVGDAYLEAQLAAFADGSRPSSAMQQFASNMPNGDRAAVSRYFSSLPAPDGIRKTDTEAAVPSDTGAWLATRGRWQQGLPACAQCHGPGGSGVGSAFPPLAGQPADYIKTQLHAWQAGKRPPGPLGLMAAVASKLSDADIDALAGYYSAQAPAAAAAR